jgi:excinuclease ABC subunit A
MSWAPKNWIELRGVRQNNLRNLDVRIPFRSLTVITGLSGSGKSSLAFDTLYAEGQRRYIDSLSTYTRQFLEKMSKPEVDEVRNIPPSIALEQKNSILNSRSTVGTQTEIVDYLRVLYARAGRTYCPDCKAEVKRVHPAQLLEWASQWLPGKKALLAVEFQATPKKKAAKKSGLGSKKKHTPNVSIQSLLEVLQGQGYRRLFLKPESRVLDLEDSADLEKLKLAYPKLEPKDLLVVLDRYRVSSTSQIERSRVREAIERGLQISRQARYPHAAQLHFISLEETPAKFQTHTQGFACLKCERNFQEPEPHLFSFNSPLGACDHCSGFGHTLEIDESIVVPDPSKKLDEGAVDPFTKPSFSDWQTEMLRFLKLHQISSKKRYRELTPAEKKLLWYGDGESKKFPGILGCFDELSRWKYKLHVRVFIRRYQTQSLCPVCQGARLKPEALAVLIGEKNFHEICEMPISELVKFFPNLKLRKQEMELVTEVYQQIEKRLKYLDAVGVGYLTLSRLSKTLSGGEFQRISLATQLGHGLCGTLYVLDEPSIGLHASDTEQLLTVLKQLRDQGNTVVVVEHDLEVMRAADWLIELGPQAGRKGGEIVVAGSPETVRAHPNSLTGKYLTQALTIPPFLSQERPVAPTKLRLTGCREHNLKGIDVEFPLERWVTVTGVSGSGKSTLVHSILYRALAKHFEPSTPELPGKFDRLYGAEFLSGVSLLDQSPIGRSSRSNPATYLKAWDEVRKIYASQMLSLRRGYTPQYFSFNVDGGRCSTCKGEGEVALDMHFMAEIKIPCEECGGKRFKKTVLEVEYRGKSVSDLLEMTIDEAFELFRDQPSLARKLRILRDVGLGYLKVGQSGSSLSGGESQRLKIASTLEEKQGSKQLYIFDEPTTGLHLEDIRKLIGVIQDLVESRHSVIMIEHHLDMIAQSDYVIDLGPKGGAEGGKLLAQGRPRELILNPDSVTGKVLNLHGYGSVLTSRG